MMMKKQSEMPQNQTVKTVFEPATGKVELSQEISGTKSTLSADEKRAILRARAQTLAIEKTDESVSEEFLEIIGFRLSTETYGIETAFVREVYPLKDFTMLPGIPAFVLGIINVRGQIISVIDLKKFFNLPGKGLGELNKVIIIKNDRMEFGILADVILGTQLIPVASIQTSLPKISGIGGEYLKGVTAEHLIMLDAKNILEDEKIIVNQ
jgi:purine-binding chemotaxis protein CheW